MSKEPQHRAHIGFFDGEASTTGAWPGARSPKRTAKGAAGKQRRSRQPFSWWQSLSTGCSATYSRAPGSARSSSANPCSTATTADANPAARSRTATTRRTAASSGSATTPSADATAPRSNSTTTTGATTRTTPRATARATTGTTARTITRARILLQADQALGGPAWHDGRIADALGCGRRTVERVRQRLVEEGLDATLAHKPQCRPRRQRVLDGAAEARLIALACSEPPVYWTLSGCAT